MNRKRVISILMTLMLTLALTFSMSNVVLARTTESAIAGNDDIKLIKINYVSREFVERQISNSPRVSSSSLQIPAGRSYLGHFTFTDTNLGINRYYMGWHVRLCIAWKSADSGGDIDLNTKFFGNQYRFYCSNDGDGKDSSGYYYIEAPAIGIIYGDHSSIYYDAVTRAGWTAPGYLRSGDVHTWVDVW